MQHKPPPKPKLKPLDLGEMPVDAFAKHGINLPAGRVTMSISAQKHALDRHPADFHLCEPYLDQCVAEPSHVGQSPHHDDGVELVLEMDEHIVLVAVSTVPDASGNYPVKSTYPIASDTLEGRVRKKRLTKI